MGSWADYTAKASPIVHDTRHLFLPLYYPLLPSPLILLALFPDDTLVVNVSGSCLLSFFMVMVLGRFELPAEYRQLFAIGFVGSYTTFSTLTYETLELAEQGDLMYAALNMLGSLVLGLFAGYPGMVLGRLV